MPSLVGSEMCIRDRAHRSTNKPHVSPGAASRKVVAGSIGGQAGRCRHRWCAVGLCQQAPGSPKRRKERRTIGVPRGSTRSRPDGMGTVGSGEAAGGRGRSDGQRRSWPWDSRRGGGTSCRWARGPAGSEAIINSRWLGARGGSCSSACPSGNAARRGQGSRSWRIALWRRGRRGRISDPGRVGSW